jgi:OOP family OmpA-OmpF porin
MVGTVTAGPKRLCDLIMLAAFAWSYGAPALGQDLFDEPGVYFGVEAGAVDYDNACEPHALACDGSDAAASAFAGYRFSSRLSLELGYHDLGEAVATYPRLTSTVEVTGALDGYDVSVIVGIPVTPKWQAFLRAGAFRSRAETSSEELDAADEDWFGQVGGGIAWHFRPAWQVRFQYLYLPNLGGVDTGEFEGRVLTAGASYFVGRHARATAR